MRPAMWAVRYAVRSPQGGLLVAYWAALLAAGLPAMHAVAAARQLPIILIRKVLLDQTQPPCGVAVDCNRADEHRTDSHCTTCDEIVRKQVTMAAHCCSFRSSVHAST